MLKTQPILDFALKKFKNWTFNFFLIFNSRWATKIRTDLYNSKLETSPNLIFGSSIEMINYVFIVTTNKDVQ